LFTTNWVYTALTTGTIRIVITGVHINTGPALLISPISVDNLEFEFNHETNITVHFENVNFTAGGGQIIVILFINLA
jgi:hypothetical protein